LASAEDGAFPNPKLRRDLRPGRPIVAESGNLTPVDGNTWPSDYFSTGARCGQSGPDTAADELSLKFRDKSEDAEHQPAIGSRGVQHLVKGNAQRVEFRQGLRPRCSDCALTIIVLEVQSARIGTNPPEAWP
jgi:hypothetical protein